VNLINPDINEQIMDVYTITIFPGYNSTYKLNDVALIWVYLQYRPKKSERTPFSKAQFNVDSLFLTLKTSYYV
jgi:hypothetical protein